MNDEGRVLSMVCVKRRLKTAYKTHLEVHQKVGGDDDSH